MAGQGSKDRRTGLKPSPLTLMAIVLLLAVLLPIAGYSAAYLRLSSYEDVDLPVPAKGMRFRTFGENWQPAFFRPAAKVEERLVGRHLILTSEENTIWVSYPNLEN